MKLIGMLDSPFVRRVAISLEALGVPFEHDPASVFSTFEIKAPKLVCDDGEVLMDSSLILQFVEATVAQRRVLWSAEPLALQHEFRAVSLALSACEKGVQIVYERKLRPNESQYEPWMERVTGQLLAGFSMLEQEVQRSPQTFENPDRQAAITVAVVWQWTQRMLASVVPAASHPGLVALSERLEKTPAFIKFPPYAHGVERRVRSPV
ncbi:glutathione S-transferase [Massilia glaciei]|uniref:Glutathione S-transferase n=1 Tax=Massilia glaciei TaxID=1524097 RepID=A0A2U2HG64_9BURK|nr:glutathione S-transferase [Massilia glaciei]PWF43697.1 glutathione S-transferase [Massilia glaciei]